MRNLQKLSVGAGLFLLATLPVRVAPPLAQAPQGGPGTAAGPVVGRLEPLDPSPPLATIPPRLPSGTARRPIEVPLGRAPRGRTRFDPFGGQIDPVVENFPSGGYMPSPLLTFEGISNSQTGYVPPDTNGDIGPNHYVQTVNAAFAVWDRSGNLLYGPATISTIFAGGGSICESTNPGDPIVLYDHLADRWLLSQFAFNEDAAGDPTGPFYECIAISTTGDPLGSWWRYAILISSTKLNDYPKFGVWPDGYYMSVNQFQYPGGTFAGVRVQAFQRTQMLSGLSARWVYFDLQSVSALVPYFGLLPSDLDGLAPPAGTPNYFVEMLDDSQSELFPFDRIDIWEFRVTWGDPTTATFGGVNSSPNRVLGTSNGLAAFEPMCELVLDDNCIPQPGTNQRLDVISDRLMYRVQYRKFDDHETLVLNHMVDASPRNGPAAIRWYELRKSGSALWSIHQQGTYAPDSDHRWMGSIAMNKAGSIAIGFSVASASAFPSIRYAGRVATDPLGTMGQGETTLWAGSGSQTGSFRWGDYSMLSVDPVDDHTFWYTNQYYSSSSPTGWRTRIGSFRFGDDTTGVLQTWQYFFAVDSLETPYVGDFNGDGMTDIITFTRQNPNAFGDVYVSLSQGDRFESLSTKWHDFFAINTSEQIIIGDFDGDGKDDIGTWLADTIRQVYVALSLGTGMGENRVWVDRIGSASSDLIFAGDANGDGKKDLIAFARTEGKVYVALSDGTRFGTPTVWHTFFAVSTYERPRVADVNGDGKADIVTFATDSPTAFGDVYVASSTGSQFVDLNGVPNSSSKWHDFFAIRPTEEVRIGDFNGDGKDDFFTFLPAPWSQCYVVQSQGNAMGPNVLWVNGGLVSRSTDRPFVGDANGDGKADIILFRQDPGDVKVVLTP